MTKKKPYPPLLELIESRRMWERPEFKAPKHTPKQLVAIEAAAAKYGAANPSDPFARSRKRLYLLRGIDDLM